MESSKSVNMFTAIASNQIKVRYALGIIDKTDVMHQIKKATKMTLIVIVKACPLSFFLTDGLLSFSDRQLLCQL